MRTRQLLPQLIVALGVAALPTAAVACSCARPPAAGCAPNLAPGEREACQKKVWDWYATEATPIVRRASVIVDGHVTGLETVRTGEQRREQATLRAERVWKGVARSEYVIVNSNTPSTACGLSVRPPQRHTYLILMDREDGTYDLTSLCTQFFVTQGARSEILQQELRSFGEIRDMGR